jgi:hypothetical protein
MMTVSEIIIISVGPVRCCHLPDYRALVPVRCDQCGKRGGHHPACILRTQSGSNENVG